MRISSILGGSLIVLSLTGFGCNPFASFQAKVNQKISETVTDKVLEAASGGKVQVDTQTGGITVKDAKTGESVSFGADVKIPDGFPTDIPRYEGSKISIVSLAADKKSAVMAVMVEGKSSAEVVTWYQQKLLSEGFKASSETNASEVLFSEYTKDNITMNLTVIGGMDDGKSMVQVQISRQIQETE